VEVGGWGVGGWVVREVQYIFMKKRIFIEKKKKKNIPHRSETSLSEMRYIQKIS
jgi:hypothetical protein